MNNWRSLAACAAIYVSLHAGGAQAQLFSIDLASPTIGTLTPAGVISAADVLGPPGLGGGPPTIVISSAQLGLLAQVPVGQQPDDLNAFSYQLPQPDAAPSVYFTVDRAAGGLPLTGVATERAAGQAAGDVFFSKLNNTNSLAINQSQLGLIPPVPPGVVPPPGAIDHVNALEAIHPLVPTPNGLMFTLAPGSQTLVLIGATSADILTANPLQPPGAPPIIAIPAAQMGLQPQDVVDALMFPGNPVNPVFSLAPGSPTLGLIGGGVGPGDLLMANIGGPVGPLPIVFVTAAQLGLAPGDNLTGVAAVPEPGEWAMLLAGLGLIAVRLRRNGGQGALPSSS